jgi:hypothetical protein
MRGKPELGDTLKASRERIRQIEAGGGRAASIEPGGRFRSHLN